MLKTILSISGKPGLYKLISQGKNMLIVESVNAEKKRFPAYGNEKIISLADIAMYTDDAEVPLYDVLEAIKEKEKSAQASIDPKKATPEQLREYLAEVLPNFDRERVYVADIKKLVAWYNILISNGITEFKPEGEIKEEEPVTYGRSRVEFVISTAQAQKEGTIGVVLDEAAPQIVQQAEEQCIRAGITKERVRFFTKEEAALGVVGFRGDNLLRGNSVIFDYTKKRFICYEIRKTKDRVLVDSRDYTEQIKDAVANEEKDIAFLQIIKQALVRGVTATVYLCGEGFEGSWFKQSTKALCLGRRVFMSKHLFACGAVYLCENDKHVSRDEVVFAQNVTISQIGLVVHHHGRDMFCPLIMDGKPWKESRGEIEIFVSGVNGLIFEVRNRSGIKKASICMSLDGMKKDPNLVYKLRIQGEYIKADQCKIKITDLGFGQIRQASYQTWQQVIQLERGDYHE